MTGHVFISYSSQDRAYVDRVATFFEDENVPVWLDSAVAPGDAFEEMIRTRIVDCAAFVVVLTPASAASRWVVGEVLQAVDAGKVIVPLLLAACDLPVPLKGFRYVDVTSGGMPSPQCLEKLRDLVGTEAPTGSGRHRTTAGAANAIPSPRPATEPAASARASASPVASVASVAPVTAASAPGSDGASGGTTGAGTSPRPGGIRPTNPPFTDTWPDVVTSATERAALTGHDRSIYAVAVSRDGRWLASASDDFMVRIWDMGAWGHASETCAAVLTGHTGRVTTVAFAPDGSWLATGADDGKVRIWDRGTGGCHATLFTGPVHSLAITADGTLVTVRGSNLSTWNLAERRVRASLDPPVESDRRMRITALAIAPDGTWLAAGDDRGTLRIWDLTAHELQTTVAAATKEITAIVISADGARIAAASEDGTVRLWHQSTRGLGATFAGYTADKIWWTPPLSPNDYRFGQGGRETVWAVAIAPDATWLATAESDRITRIWETSTGDVRAILRSRGSVLGRKAGAPWRSRSLRMASGWPPVTVTGSSGSGTSRALKGDAPHGLMPPPRPDPPDRVAQGSQGLPRVTKT